MNVLRKQTGDLTEHGLNPFSHQLLVITAPAIITALGVLLSRWSKLNAISLLCHIFCSIVSVPAIHEELTARRQRERQHIEAARVRSRARQESKLYGHALFGGHDLDFDSIEVAPFRADAASELLAFCQ